MSTRRQVTRPRVATKLLATVLLTLVTIVPACTTAARQAPPVCTPQFDYAPPDTAATASADVAFAIVQPCFAESQAQVLGGPFEDFAESFAADFQEILSERGFTVVGTFESYQRMTYPQRRRADLALVLVFEFGTETRRLSSDYNFKVLTESTYTQNGTDQLSGQITLAAREKLTGERMWYRKLDLPTRNVPWRSTTELTKSQANRLVRGGRENVSRVLIRSQDPGILNAMSKVLEDYYTRSLETTWTYLNPEEMAHLKALADSLKADYAPGG